MVATPQLLLGRADWPAEPYGFNHGREVSEVAQSIAASLGLVGDELLMARAVGMFHDLGRRETAWYRPDPDHGRRGAERALHCLMEDPNWEALDGTGLLSRGIRIIAQHRLDGPPPRDPIAIALHDADILESSRHAPGTREGNALLERLYPRCISEFARQPRVQEHHARKYLTPQTVGEPWTHPYTLVRR